MFDPPVSIAELTVGIAQLGHGSTDDVLQNIEMVRQAVHVRFH